MSEEHKNIESQLKLLPPNKQEKFISLWDSVKTGVNEVGYLYYNKV